MTVDRLLSLATVLATVIAALFAWRAAVAGNKSASAGERAAKTGERAAAAAESAVGIAQKARREEQVSARIRALNRIEEALVVFDGLAKDDAEHGPPGGSGLYVKAQDRLGFALIGVPTAQLPTCRRIVNDKMFPLAAKHVLPAAAAELDAVLKAELEELQRLARD